jgi:hypothetical protein
VILDILDYSPVYENADDRMGSYYWGISWAMCTIPRIVSSCSLLGEHYLEKFDALDPSEGLDILDYKLADSFAVYADVSGLRYSLACQPRIIRVFDHSANTVTSAENEWGYYYHE